MTYEMFKVILERDIKEILPEENRENVRIIREQKNNVQYDGIICTMEYQDEFEISPVIPISDLYRLYNDGMDYGEIIRNVAAVFQNPEYRQINVREIMEKAKNPENLRLCLINTELNKEMLKRAANIPFKDLSIVFRSRIDDEKSTILGKGLLKEMGMTAEELYEKVKEISAGTYTITPLWQTALDKMRNDMDMPEAFVTEIEKELEKEPVYIITNQNGKDGAIAMTDTDILDKAAAMLKTDRLSVIPSSVHDIIVMPAEMIDKKYLLDMVKQINRESIILEERLSDNIYGYDSRTKELEMYQQPEKIIQRDRNR